MMKIICLSFPKRTFSKDNLLDFCYLKKWLNITKTCLYNFDSLKPQFYIVKLGGGGVFTGVYINLQNFPQNIDCGNSLERVPKIYVLSRNMKNIKVFI